MKESFLPSVHCEPGHHVPRVSLLHTDVDRLPPTTHIRIPSLHQVSGVNHYVGVNVSRVDPLPREVLRQEAAGLHDGRSDRDHLHPDGRLLHSLDLVTLRCDGLTQEIVVISVLHKATELLVSSRLLGVSHGEVLVLTNDPVAQTGELHHRVFGPLHTIALLVGHIELLIRDEKLGPNVLTRVDDLLGVGADTSGHEPVLVRELEHALNGGSAVDRSVALREHGDHLLVVSNGGAHGVE